MRRGCMYELPDRAVNLIESDFGTICVVNFKVVNFIFITLFLFFMIHLSYVRWVFHKEIDASGSLHSKFKNSVESKGIIIEISILVIICIGEMYLVYRTMLEFGKTKAALLSTVFTIMFFISYYSRIRDRIFKHCLFSALLTSLSLSIFSLLCAAPNLLHFLFIQIVMNCFYFSCLASERYVFFLKNDKECKR